MPEDGQVRVPVLGRHFNDVHALLNKVGEKMNANSGPNRPQTQTLKLERSRKGYYTIHNIVPFNLKGTVLKSSINKVPFLSTL